MNKARKPNISVCLKVLASWLLAKIEFRIVFSRASDDFLRAVWTFPN
jgi:hypothetical protein